MYLLILFNFTFWEVPCCWTGLAPRCQIRATSGWEQGCSNMSTLAMLLLSAHLLAKAGRLPTINLRLPRDSQAASDVLTSFTFCSIPAVPGILVSWGSSAAPWVLSSQHPLLLCVLRRSRCRGQGSRWGEHSWAPCLLSLTQAVLSVIASSSEPGSRTEASRLPSLPF